MELGDLTAFGSRDSRTTGLQLEEQGSELFGLLCLSLPWWVEQRLQTQRLWGHWTWPEEGTTGVSAHAFVCVLGGWCYDKLGGTSPASRGRCCFSTGFLLVNRTGPGHALDQNKILT